MRGVPGTEYIGKAVSHGHTYYNIQKKVDGKYRYFGSGKTLIEALMKRDWVEYHNWTKKYPRSSKCDEKYINQRNSGTYVVERCMNGNMVYYGGFNNLEDAIKYRDFLIKKGWSNNYIYKNPMRCIQQRHGNYQVKVYLNGKNNYVGTFHSLEHAKIMRDLFIKYDGDWDLICEGFENNNEEWMNDLSPRDTFFQKVNRGLSDTYWATKCVGMYKE